MIMDHFGCSSYRCTIGVSFPFSSFLLTPPKQTKNAEVRSDPSDAIDRRVIFVEKRGYMEEED